MPSNDPGGKSKSDTTDSMGRPVKVDANLIRHDGLLRHRVCWKVENAIAGTYPSVDRRYAEVCFYMYYALQCSLGIVAAGCVLANSTDLTWPTAYHLHPTD